MYKCVLTSLMNATTESEGPKVEEKRKYHIHVRIIYRYIMYYSEGPQHLVLTGAVYTKLYRCWVTDLNCVWGWHGGHPLEPGTQPVEEASCWGVACSSHWEEWIQDDRHMIPLQTLGKYSNLLTYIYTTLQMVLCYYCIYTCMYRISNICMAWYKY